MIFRKVNYKINNLSSAQTIIDIIVCHFECICVFCESLIVIFTFYNCFFLVDCLSDATNG